MPHPCRVPNRRSEPFISVTLSVFFSSAAASPTFLRSLLPLVYRSVRMDEREDFTSFWQRENSFFFCIVMFGEMCACLCVRKLPWRILCWHLVWSYTERVWQAWDLFGDKVCVKERERTHNNCDRLHSLKHTESLMHICKHDLFFHFFFHSKININP